MEFHLWLSLAIVCTLGAMSPGPSIALVIKNTINGGKLQGYYTAISHGFGVALYAALTATGIGIVIVKSPTLFISLQLAGAIFLFYLGVSAFLRKNNADKIQYQQENNLSVNGWRDGFLIAFLNPKIALFFLALFSQFVNINANWQEKAIMTATASIIDALWYLLVAFTVSQGKILNFLQKYNAIIEKVMGVLLILIALRVMFMIVIT